MNGQLMPKEREFLHEAVLQAKPKIVLEVGTWKGGGSTWNIVKALEKNGSGVLFTCETDKDFFDEAHQIYSKDPSHILMHHMKSSDLIKEMIELDLIPDFLFFDGPEDETTALEDFRALNPLLRQGAVLMMHDWDAPSIKARLMRPYLENLSGWKILEVLTAPESVGLVKAIKL